MLEVAPVVVKEGVQVAEHLNLVSLARTARSCVGLAEEAGALGKVGVEGGLTSNLARPAVGRIVESGAAELPEVSLEPGLLQLASLAGAKEKFGAAAIEVYAHGTTAGEVATFVGTQGRNLSETGGNFGGKFYTAANGKLADLFAGRASERLRGEPRVLGMAIPRSLAENLHRSRLLQTTPIGDIPGLQSVFYPSSFRSLKAQGFFFDLTKARELHLAQLHF